MAPRVISWKVMRRTGTLGLSTLQQMPADGLSLAVLIRRQQDLVGASLSSFFSLGHLLLATRLGDNIDGRRIGPRD